MNALAGDLAGRQDWGVSSVSVALLSQETLLTPAKTEQVGKKECGGKRQTTAKDKKGPVWEDWTVRLTFLFPILP